MRTAWMVRRPVSSRMRLTYRRDLYGVSFLPYLSRSLNFCGQKWIFPMVVNLVHESMFSIFAFMNLQEKDLSQSLW